MEKLKEQAIKYLKEYFIITKPTQEETAKAYVAMAILRDNLKE